MLPVVSARSDAIVVLGCRVTRNAPSALQRRAETAARAFHEQGPRWVIASGGRRWQGLPEATALRDLLVARGVPDDRIVRELWSLTTIENASYSAELLRAASIHRVSLVTCDWHMPRALVCFAACGLTPSPLASPSPREGALARGKRHLLERARTWAAQTSLPIWFEP